MFTTLIKIFYQIVKEIMFVYKKHSNRFRYTLKFEIILVLKRVISIDIKTNYFSSTFMRAK